MCWSADRIWMKNVRLIEAIFMQGYLCVMFMDIVNLLCM